ncbi:hypothetical protein F3Y22_tig00110450pilonHSYRG00153 [Hibiscus syriacus]|uniref:Myb/SANT-like domain-containing protein n=1 Tax=Hibiscus syriacus TaxID=106335 RepID=A0A6A3ANE0_HIBSY|nr:hypothetical protein F3Y22_tig00110450pilonHSYRG00153 [Hibiscus syriacus]
MKLRSSSILLHEILLTETTRRHWASQTVCFLEDKSSSNVCAAQTWPYIFKGLQRNKNQIRDAGSTASTAILVGDRLIVANVGDSRALISLTTHFVQLFTPNIQPITSIAIPPCYRACVLESITVPPRHRPSTTDMGEKQQWSNEHLKCLLETCIEEINNVGRKGLSLHKESWIKLGRVLKIRFGMELSQKQMKNAYDNLKAKYIGWVYLKNKIGNLYKPQTNTFTLTNEEWEEFRKGHPKAALLKTVPLPFPELYAALFDGNSATGNCKWTSTQTTSGVGSSSCHHVQPLLLTKKSFIDSEDDDGTSHEPSSEPTPNTSVDPPLSASVDPPPESSPTFDRPSKRAKTSKSLSDKIIVTFDDIAVDMQKALQYIVKNKDGPTSVECYEKLKLCNLDPMDPLFLAAFSHFWIVHAYERCMDDVVGCS